RSPGSHLAVPRRRGRLGDQRLESLFDGSVESESKPLAKHLDRLREADVAGDAAVGMTLFELHRRIADPEPAMNVLAKAGHIDNATSANRLDVPTDTRRRRQQGVEDKTRVDASPQNCDAMFTRGGIDFGGVRREPAERKRQLFAGRDYARAAPDDLQDVR